METMFRFYFHLTTFHASAAARSFLAFASAAAFSASAFTWAYFLSSSFLAASASAAAFFSSASFLAWAYAAAFLLSESACSFYACYYAKIVFLSSFDWLIKSSEIEEPSEQ